MTGFTEPEHTRLSIFFPILLYTMVEPEHEPGTDYMAEVAFGIEC